MTIHLKHKHLNTNITSGIYNCEKSGHRADLELNLKTT